MKRNSLLVSIVVATSAITSTVSGFSFIKINSAIRHMNSVEKTIHTRNPTKLFVVEKRTSFSQYEHDHVEPKVQHFIQSGIENHLEPSKRKEADKYWEQQYVDDKKKLHNKMGSDTWSHYKDEYVEPKTVHKKEMVGITNHIDAKKRANADEFWSEKYQDDKKRLRNLQEEEGGVEATSSATTDMMTSFSKYEHDNIDPKVQHFIQSGIENHMEPSKREEADKYWENQYVDDKKKLHHMMGSDTWSHYKNEYVEPNVKHHGEQQLSGITNHIDPAKRAISDEYWLEKYQEEKAKIHHKKITPPNEEEMDDLSKTSPMDFLP